jgi:hypothetical protein
LKYRLPTDNHNRIEHYVFIEGSTGSVEQQVKAANIEYTWANYTILLPPVTYIFPERNAFTKKPIDINFNCGDATYTATL